MQIYDCTDYTGGMEDCLDYTDGNDLNDGDIGRVRDSLFFIANYLLDADSGLTPDGITIIAPATNPGAKRWILLSIRTEALDAELAAIAGLTSAADKVPYFTGSGTAALADFTSYGRSIAAVANEAAFKALVNLEIGTDVLAQQTIGIGDDNLVEIDSADVADDDYAKFTANGLEGRSYAEVKSDLGVISEVVEDTTPELGGDLGLNEKSVIYNPSPTDDHTWNGFEGTGTAGENVAFPNCCYLKSDGKYWKTDADAEATSKGKLAIAGGTISADAAGTFIEPGTYIRDDSWSMTAGEDAYLNCTTGEITDETNRPTGSGDILRVIGVWVTASILYFNPSPEFFEIA